MNELTPYEQLIAAKLDQVPVPDMADGIWSAIEMQLDAPAQKPASAVKGKGWYVVAGVVAVVLVLLWYFGHKRLGDTIPSTPLPEKQAPLPAATPPVKDSPASDRPAGKKSIPAAPAGTKKDTVSFYPFPKDSVRAEPAAGPMPPPVPVDSPALQTNRPALPDIDPYQSAPPAPRGKKPRGVKGITDDDYKLTVAKDSAKKKY